MWHYSLRSPLERSNQSCQKRTANILCSHIHLPQRAANSHWLREWPIRRELPVEGEGHSNGVCGRDIHEGQTAWRPLSHSQLVTTHGTSKAAECPGGVSLR